MKSVFSTRCVLQHMFGSHAFPVPPSYPHRAVKTGVLQHFPDSCLLFEPRSLKLVRAFMTPSFEKKTQQPQTFIRAFETTRCHLAMNIHKQFQLNIIHVITSLPWCDSTCANQTLILKCSCEAKMQLQFLLNEVQCIFFIPRLNEFLALDTGSSAFDLLDVWLQHKTHCGIDSHFCFET